MSNELDDLIELISEGKPLKKILKPDFDVSITSEKHGNLLKYLMKKKAYEDIKFIMKYLNWESEEEFVNNAMMKALKGSYPRSVIKSILNRVFHPEDFVIPAIKFAKKDLVVIEIIENCIHIYPQQILAAVKHRRSSEVIAAMLRKAYEPESRIDTRDLKYEYNDDESEDDYKSQSEDSSYFGDSFSESESSDSESESSESESEVHNVDQVDYVKLPDPGYLKPYYKIKLIKNLIKPTNDPMLNGDWN